MVLGVRARAPHVSSPVQEEEAIGDVDLFTVSEDGAELTVNAKWLQHLQERLLGEDGHPRKASCLPWSHHHSSPLRFLSAAHQ